MRGIMPDIDDAAGRIVTPSLAASRADLLKRVERWTHGRKIELCQGICAKVISANDAILAHGRARDRIDRWIGAYRRMDFEALKNGYRRKRRRH